MVISFVATTTYDYPILYINQTTGKINGILSRVWLKKFLLYERFNVTWIGNEIFSGTCVNNQCTGVLKIIQLGKSDTSVRDVSLQSLDRIYDNISLSSPIREDRCEFLTHFAPYTKKTYATDSLESFKIFKPDVWLFAFFFFMLIVIFIDCYAHKTGKFNRWTWVSKVFSGRRYYSSNPIVDLVSLTVTLSLYQVFLIYSANFSTDSAVEISKKPISSFKDLITDRRQFGIYKQGVCYKMLETINNSNINKLARPYISSKDYYLRQRKSSMFVLFAGVSAVTIHSAYYCAINDGSRSYLRNSPLPPNILTFPIRSSLDEKIKQTLLRRIYSIFELDLARTFWRNLTIDLCWLYFHIKSQGPCTRRIDTGYQLRYTENILINYKIILIALIFTFALSAIVFNTELIVYYYFQNLGKKKVQRNLFSEK